MFPFTQHISKVYLAISYSDKFRKTCHFQIAWPSAILFSAIKDFPLTNPERGIQVCLHARNDPRERPFIKVLFQIGTRAPFLESPGNFSGSESHSKISNITITALFDSRILNMNRGSLHTRSFRHIHYSVCRYR